MIRWSMQAACGSFVGLVLLGNGFHFPGMESVNVVALQRLSRLYDWAWYQGDDGALLQFSRSHLLLSNGDGAPLLHAVRRIGFRPATDLRPDLDSRRENQALVFLETLLPRIGRIQDALKLHHLLLAIRFPELTENWLGLWPELLSTGALGPDRYQEWLLADPDQRQGMERQALAQIHALVSAPNSPKVPE